MKKKNNIISNIENYLAQEYGEIKPEWQLLINLLADNVQQYAEVKKSIEENGLFDTTTFKKNPLIATLKDLQATMLKQIQHLGLSPYAQGKIKTAPNKEIDADDFIKSLTQDNEI